MKNDFCPGDRVVFIGPSKFESKSIHNKNLKIGETYIVQAFDKDPSGRHLVGITLQQWWFIYDEVVLEEIYNSPLYMALNEK